MKVLIENEFQKSNENIKPQNTSKNLTTMSRGNVTNGCHAYYRECELLSLYLIVEHS